jgi:hypothetical protein
MALGKWRWMCPEESSVDLWFKTTVFEVSFSNAYVANWDQVLFSLFQTLKLAVVYILAPPASKSCLQNSLAAAMDVRNNPWIMFFVIFFLFSSQLPCLPWSWYNLCKQFSLWRPNYCLSTKSLWTWFLPSR